MKCVKLAIADGDPVSLKRYVDGLKSKRNIDIVAYTADGAELIEKLNEVQADVVLTGLTLKRVDGLGVLEAIGTMPGSHPRALIMSEMTRSFAVDMAAKLGADYYLTKPVSCDLLYRRICQLAENGCEDEEETWGDALECRTAQRLSEMGIPASMKGYRYFMTAARLCAEDSEYAENLSGKLYPEVAAQMDSTPLSVERAMRTAIQAAWKEGGFARYAAETGNRHLSARKPTTLQVLRELTKSENESYN